MKTVKISALVLAMAGVFATTANAQSAKTNAWEGAYGQVSVGYGQFSPSLSNGTTSNAALYTTTGTVNNISTGVANISAGYNFGINSNYILGLGASLYPGASSSATGVLKVMVAANGATYNTQTATYNVKNLYNVYLSPGYVIDKDKLAYLKVGYTGATIGLSSPLIPYNTTNLSGYTLGVGYKQMITSSLYMLGEFNYASYGSVTASTTTTTGLGLSVPVKGTGMDFLVGLGYRF